MPIDSAKPSDSIKASWGPSDASQVEPGPSQFEQNVSVPIPSRLEAELAAERAVTEALAKDLSWYQTVIDNPLAGSKSPAGYVLCLSSLRRSSPGFAQFCKIYCETAHAIDDLNYAGQRPCCSSVVQT